MFHWKRLLQHLRSERNLVVWGCVLAVAVFSAYVHTLHRAVDRTEARPAVHTPADAPDDNAVQIALAGLRFN